MKKNKSEEKLDLDLPGYQENYDELLFTSAYKALNGEEPTYTTWKKRKGGEDKHTIDYIFYQRNKGVEVISVLEIPGEKTINPQTLLPGWEYPSDHLAIMAEFEL